MDRLQTLALAALFVGCGGGEESAPPGRVEAVPMRSTAEAARFCDERWEPGEGPELALPPLEGSVPSGGARWVNVWATWCEPCVAELPLLAAWERELATEGAPFSLALVSVDTSQEAIAAFREAHPGAPSSARLSDPARMGELTRGLGLGATASLPMHAIVGPDGRLRCARAGAISEDDRAVVRALMR